MMGSALISRCQATSIRQAQFRALPSPARYATPPTWCWVATPCVRMHRVAWAAVHTIATEHFALAEHHQPLCDGERFSWPRRLTVHLRCGSLSLRSRPDRVQGESCDSTAAVRASVNLCLSVLLQHSQRRTVKFVSAELITQDEVQAPPKPPSPSTPMQREEEPVAGQTTAIVTGVVSIAFGVRSALLSIYCLNCQVPDCCSFAKHATPCTVLIIHAARQVLYLVLVQLLDSRGGELQPPPPEAFGL